MQNELQRWPPISISSIKNKKNKVKPKTKKENNRSGMRKSLVPFCTLLSAQPQLSTSIAVLDPSFSIHAPLPPNRILYLTAVVAIFLYRCDIQLPSHHRRVVYDPPPHLRVSPDRSSTLHVKIVLLFPCGVPQEVPRRTARTNLRYKLHVRGNWTVNKSTDKRVSIIIGGRHDKGVGGDSGKKICWGPLFFVGVYGKFEALRRIVCINLLTVLRIGMALQTSERGMLEGLPGRASCWCKNFFIPHPRTQR